MFSHLPASSFDWGAEGYAGCSNNGGELLYLSAPSPTNGLIMARGNFSTSLYASLSRAQIDFGGPATFGLELSRTEHAYNPKDNGNRVASSFRLGDMIERGSFNYRWPVNEYYLDLHENLDLVQSYTQQNTIRQDNFSKHVGTCQMFSCAMKGIFYQVLRIEEDGHIDKQSEKDGNFVENSDLCRHFPSDAQIVLTMGGPVWFHTFKERLHDHVLTETGQLRTITRQDASSGPEIDEVDDESPKINSSGDRYKSIRFWDRRRKIGLEANVYQVQNGDYTPLELTKSRAAADSGPVEVQKKTRVPAYNAVIPLEQPKTVHSQQPRSATFLATIRLFEGEENWGNGWPQHLPNSESIYKHVGINPSSDFATGAMWETAFIERRNKLDSVLDLAGLTLVARSLEKILQVDIVPANFFEVTSDSQNQAKFQNQKPVALKTQPMALVSNLFVRLNVDLKALL
jgi:hypothetical protein